MTSETMMIKLGEIICDPDAKYFDFKRKEISQIFVSGGDEDGIVLIQFLYMENGKCLLSEQYGPRTSIYQFNIIELNYPEEYITGVYGKYFDRYGRIMVITFTTNIREYGPFGVTNPNLQSQSSFRKSFNYSLGTSGQFGGFHGAFNKFGLLYLSLYLSPKAVLPSFDSKGIIIRVPRRVRA